MKTYINKSKRSAANSQVRSESPSSAQTPNSAYLAAMENRGGGMEDLEARMMARMQSYRNAQLPEAEREADAIASTVNPSASTEEVKSTLGQKLGADFSKVSIHTDASAHDMADSIGAEAYTQGNDVYLGEGASNARTVAHELVHTVQQGGVSGMGVSQSAAFGTVQMKPGKRARLKNWFKRKFHGKPTTKTNEYNENVTFDGVDKIIEPDELMATQAYTSPLFGKKDAVNSRIENYHHTDVNAKVRQMEAGDYDSYFDALETDAERVEELQRLAQYLSAVREENARNRTEMSDYDRALDQTYKSSLQKASGSDSFMMELMKQTTNAATAMHRAQAAGPSQETRDRLAKEHYSKDWDKHDWNADNKETREKNQKQRLQERANYSEAYAADVYQNVRDGDLGRRFNTLRFMMGDATALMIDGKHRLKWNEKSRMHFSDESNGYKGLHEGQMKTGPGADDYTDISRYVSEVYDANRVYENMANYYTATDKNKKLLSEKHQERNQDYIKNFQLRKRNRHDYS